LQVNELRDYVTPWSDYIGLTVHLR